MTVSQNNQSSGIIRFLHELFNRFGIPDTIVSDNGKQFTAKEFKDFCKAFLIVHISIRPYHLQSNGEAERFVDTFKQILKRSDGNESVDDILQFLRIYRMTPNLITNSGLWPAELMFARKIRSVFDKLLPKENQKPKIKKKKKK